MELRDGFIIIFPPPPKKKQRYTKKKQPTFKNKLSQKKKKTFKKKIKQPEKIATLIRLVNITDKWLPQEPTSQVINWYPQANDSLAFIKIN